MIFLVVMMIGFRRITMMEEVVRLDTLGSSVHIRSPRRFTFA